MKKSPLRNSKSPLHDILNSRRKSHDALNPSRGANPKSSTIPSHVLSEYLRNT
jgi:hypothetical protein